MHALADTCTHTYPGDVRQRGRLLIDDPPYQIKLHDHPAALPRAFLVPAARQVDDDAALAELLGVDFDPRQEILLATDPGDTALDNSAAWHAGEVDFRSYSSQHMLLDVEAPVDGWLFLSDTWYPGWVASIDGHEVPIHRANIAGRAIRVPAGTHEITFEYAPCSFRLGIAAAAVGLLLTLLLGLFGRRPSS